jgi:hypothetical protein
MPSLTVNVKGGMALRNGIVEWHAESPAEWIAERKIM